MKAEHLVQTLDVLVTLGHCLLPSLLHPRQQYQLAGGAVSVEGTGRGERGNREWLHFVCWSGCEQASKWVSDCRVCMMGLRDMCLCDGEGQLVYGGLAWGQARVPCEHWAVATAIGAEHCQCGGS